MHKALNTALLRISGPQIDVTHVLYNSNNTSIEMERLSYWLLDHNRNVEAFRIQGSHRLWCIRKGLFKDLSRRKSHVIRNYVNPVFCVATVCHQVRCMCWGHLGHFHRAISHLKWYRIIVCMRYSACTFCQMKSINMFFIFLQPGVPRHSL